METLHSVPNSNLFWGDKEPNKVSVRISFKLGLYSVLRDGIYKKKVLVSMK